MPRRVGARWRCVLAGTLVLALAGGAGLAPAQTRPGPQRKPGVRVLPPAPIAPEPPAAEEEGGEKRPPVAGEEGGNEAPASEGGQAVETDGAAIARLTTSPRLLPGPLATLPEGAVLPSPSKGLGHVAGAPEGLDSAAAIHGYLRRLAAGSDRLRFEVIGHSEEGREIGLVAISAPENLEALDRIRDEAAALADPRRTPRAEAERLAAQGTVVCYLVGGLHPGEVSAPAMLAELAFRLAAGDRPELEEIRRRTVVLITPVADPDGWERTVDWQRRHVDGKKTSRLPWSELREILLPPYLGHYGAAEADGLELSLAASRAVHQALARFHPQLVADLAVLPGGGADRGGAALLSLAGEGPGGPAIARRAAGALQAGGVPGARAEAAVDRAAGSDLLAAAPRAGGSRCTLSVFGNGTAGTFERQVGTIEEPPAGGPGDPWPPAGKLAWSLRDTVNLGEAAVLALLGSAAAQPAELLLGVWDSRQAALARGTGGPPYAWLFPAAQRDPARLVALAERLRAQGVELHRLTGELALGDGTHAAPGTLVVRADQPQRDALVRLLAVPAAAASQLRGGLVPAAAPRSADGGGPAAAAAPPSEGGGGPVPPAAMGSGDGVPAPAAAPRSGGGGGAAPEDVGWPFLHGVAVEAIRDPGILAAPMEPASGAPRVVGSVEGDGEVFALCDEGQARLLPARVALAAYQVDAAEAAFDAGGRACPAGSWIVQAPRAAVEPVASRFGLGFTALPALPAVPRHVLALPRLALLHTWTDTRGAGWARLALDRDKVRYTLIQLDDLRRGRLGERFDLILMPEATGGAGRLMQGIAARWQPLAYAPTPAATSLGMPDAGDDITGGFGAAELLGLRRFVRRGGVLALLGNAGRVAVEGQLAPGVGLGGETPGEAAHPAGVAGAAGVAGVAGVGGVAGAAGEDGAAAGGGEEPGAELAVTAARGEPLAYGYGEHAAVFRAAGPRFELSPGQRVHVALWFGSRRPAAAGRSSGSHAAPAGQAENGPGVPEEEPAAPPGRAGNAAAREGIEVEDLEAGKETPPGGKKKGPGPSEKEGEKADSKEGAKAGEQGAGGQNAAGEGAGAENTAGGAGEKAGDGKNAGGESAGGEPPAPFLLAGSPSTAAGLEGKPAIVDLPVGRGRVVLFAFDPFHGDRNRADVRWVYNLLLNWSHLPD
jgi:hypothetical protein